MLERPTPDSPPSRGRSLALLALTLLVGASSVVLDLNTSADSLGSRVLGEEAGWHSGVNGVLLGGLGLVVLWRASAGVRRVGWVLGGFGLFWAVDGLAESFVRFGVRPGLTRTGATLALWVVDRLGAFLPLGVVLLVLIYPTGRFLEGRWGLAARWSLAIMTLAGGSALVAPAGPLPGGGPAPAHLDRDPTSLAIPAWLSGALIALAAVSLLVPVATVFVRQRRGDVQERERMRWLLWAVAADVLVVALASMLFGEHLPTLIFTVVLGLPAVAVVIGLVHPHVVAIDDLLGATIVYGVLALVTVGLDLLALAGLTRLVGDSLDRSQVVVVVLVISAALYGPMRLQLRRAVRRVLFGDRDDPYVVVAGLASDLEQVDDGAAQLAAVASAVAAAFGLPYVRVDVERSRGERLVASHGCPPEVTRSRPITFRGEDVGTLTLPARGVRAQLAARDEQLLNDVVRQAALAVRSSRLADDLQESRERLVVAREEERRRIRRDLHDGLGPSLTGVVFGLESALLQIPSDPGQAARTVTLTRDQVQDVVADVRRLVHDLRPPALDDLGLVEALRQRAATATGPGLTFVVSASGVGELPAAVEVAAYRIIGEAMNNVVRHAGANRSEVSLAQSEDALVLEVIDDGIGIPADVESGVGLVSLRERAAELGGVCEVVCPPGGGTIVRARLPLRSA